MNPAIDVSPLLIKESQYDGGQEIVLHCVSLLVSSSSYVTQGDVSCHSNITALEN